VKRRRAVLGMALAVGLMATQATCFLFGDGANPGWVSLRLTTPNADDGGILFRVQGGPIDSVRSALPNLFVRAETDSQRVVMVANDVASGDVVAEIYVPDTKSVTLYTAIPLQAAKRATFEQQVLTGYSVRVEASR
jgi:hypothetical protein